MSLFALQMMNYVLPLFTFPYLTRVLGPERFGLLAFAGAFGQYFVTVVDYGFNLSATKKVSVNRHDPSRIAVITSSVLTIKTALAVLCLMTLSAIVSFVPKFRDEQLLYYVCYIPVVGNLLFPVWFYQGMEKIKFMSMLNVASKIISTVCVFIFIRHRSDYLLAALIPALGVVLPGLVGMILLFSHEKVTARFARWHEVKECLSDGWPIFVSLMSTSVLGNTGIFLLGLFTSNTVVGYFSIAQKVLWACINLISPIANSIYPRVSMLFHDSFDKGLAFIRKTLRYGCAVFGAMSLALFLFAGVIVHLAMGQYDPNVIMLIRIMSPLPCLIFIDNMYGMQLMLNIGLERSFMRVYLISVVFLVAASCLLIPWMQAVGSAIAQVAVELLTMSLMYFIVRARGISLLHSR